MPPSHQSQPPTAKQLAYLRSLAIKTGQTFTYPRTVAEASREIQRLKGTKPSTRTEVAIERRMLPEERAAREANCDVPIRGHETTGYGASATWSQRS
jgi:Protein of unknown function (DUF3072)